MRPARSILSILTILACFAYCCGVQAQEHWTEQSSGTTNDLLAVQFVDANNGYVVGKSGTVLKTVDGGLNWTDVSPESTGNVQDLSFLSREEGYIVMGDPSGWPAPATTSGELWHTSDGGTTWDEISFGHTASRLAVHFLSPSNGWMAGTHHDHSWPWAPAEQTTNGGAEWTPGTSALTLWNYDIYMQSSSLGWVVGNDQSNAGVIQKTTDGSSWSSQSIPTTESLYNIDFTSTSNGYAVGDAGVLVATSNGGSSWTMRPSSTSSNLRGISFGTPLFGFACGSEGSIILTTDGGDSWSSENTGTTADLNGIFNLDGTHAWAVGNAGLIISWSETVSTAGVQETHLFNLYPNPMRTSATLEFDNQYAENCTLILYDILGQQVRTISDIITGQVTIERIDLISGQYFFQLRAEGVMRVSGMLTID